VILRSLSFLVVLVAFSAAPAQSAPAGQPPAGQQKQSDPGNVERTDGDYKAARDRDDARHRLWDKKMKALTGSVCTGC
jgi:hypothetical protein